MDSNDVTPPSSPNSSERSPINPVIPPDIDGPVMQPMQHQPAGKPTHRFRKYVIPEVIVLVLFIAGAAAYAHYHKSAYKAPQSATTTSKTSPKSTEPKVSTTKVWKATVNLAAIPLGDGKVSTTPQIGYVDSCTTTFKGGGANHVGSWINETNSTWNSETKVAVQGTVHWPAADYTDTTSGSSRLFTTNDLPETYPTGTFPIATTDPAYQYDTNPNHIGTQTLSYSLPLNPTAASTPSCLSLGPIGIIDDGVVLFNALDDSGRDAVAHETQDLCNGHPNGQEIYHYHNIPSCIRAKATGSSTLVGYALDGYGIYVELDSKGNLPTNADLDACHGRTSEVMWNGKMTNIYHYDATLEYPYTVGCYHGTPIKSQTAASSNTPGATGQKQQLNSPPAP